jgi:sortase (surface protein transpeptidase)
MKIDEYREELLKIDKITKSKKAVLLAKFVEANSTFRIGDIATDHIGSIRIEEINIELPYYGKHAPTFIYLGVRLTKKGTPFKNGEQRIIHQCNLVAGKKCQRNEK